MIEPTDETSPVYRAAKKGGGLHHLGFRCKDIKEQITRLKSLGLRVITNPQPGETFENNQIAFLLGNHGLNIKLIDTKKKQKNYQLVKNYTQINYLKNRFIDVKKFAN